MGDLLAGLGGVVGYLLGLGFFAAQTWLVATAVRRVLGVRVGWPRAVLVSLMTVLGLLELIRWLLTGTVWGSDFDSNPGPVAAATGLIALWAFALAAAGLVGLEVLVPTGSLPTLRHLLFGWGERWRRGNRYWQIMAIATKHGLGAQVRGWRGPVGDVPETAVALRRALNEAGVTFVKLGQMLSTRADLLPAPYVTELATLQNRASPLPWEAVEAALADALGRPAGDVFAGLDRQPMATASVGQVHAAVLPDGQDVVVKVQRPGAEAQVLGDLEILNRISRSLERNAPWARRLGTLDLVDGFGRSLREELDYGVEADNMRALRRYLAGRGVRVPEVVAELSGKRLLVMERFDGVPVSQAAGLIAGMPADVRRAAAARLLSAILGQILTDGVFHADLHPGNVVIWPDGAVGLLDFGSVGRLDAGARRALAMLLWAIDADDPMLATGSLLELLDSPDGLDERALRRAVGGLLIRFRSGLGSGGSLAVFGELFQLVVGFGLRVPPGIAAALRSLGALEGTLLGIDPGLDLVTAARSQGREVVGPVTPERVRQEVTQRALHLLPLLEVLPRRIDRITEDLERGRFAANVRVVAHPDDRAFLNRLAQQLVIAVLSGSSVLGGILLVTAAGGPAMLPGLSLYGFLGYLLAFAGFVLALRAVALVFGRAD